MHDSLKTILLVEDEALIALQEKMQLEKDGYNVIHSLTGEKAVEIVSGNPSGIDLILMDIDLGKGIDGTEAARQINTITDIPVLFLSSHTEKEIVHKTEEITNYGYVVKSSSSTVLDASIKMAFRLFAAMRQLDLNNMEIEEKNEELNSSIENMKKINDELILSEDKFSKAFHLNPDAININRFTDGVYLEVNEGFTHIMGYTKEDVIGRSSLPGDLGIWVHAEDRTRLLQGILEHGEVANLEAEFRKKDGTTTIGLMSARIIEIKGERCIISITRDMGSWKNTQRELQEKKALLNSTLES
jgi:PAS domain S-box-containing protein